MLLTACMVSASQHLQACTARCSLQQLAGTTGQPAAAGRDHRTACSSWPGPQDSLQQLAGTTGQPAAAGRDHRTACSSWPAPQDSLHQCSLLRAGRNARLDGSLLQ